MGEWIAEENEEMEIIGFHCSNCDLPLELDYKPKFCYHCGCKMENADEDT